MQPSETTFSIDLIIHYHESNPIRKPEFWNEEFAGYFIVTIDTHTPSQFLFNGSKQVGKFIIRSLKLCHHGYLKVSTENEQ